jgi:site-specific DNA recombinase
MGSTAGAAAPAAYGRAAGPVTAEPVGVAVLTRTSTLELQDPVASYRRQLNTASTWLPQGWYIAGVYSDIESGAIDIDKRSQTDSYKVLEEAGCPRDGGLADLLREAASPEPKFSVVLVEEIERAARDTFNSIKLERDLEECGIPLIAADEPADLDGANPTTILVRRVKQGVAEWYRINLKVKTRKGLEVHTMAGFNNGPAPWGYDPDRIAHPVPMKAAQGRYKTRLAVNPELGPWVTQIYTWRIVERVSREEIAGRLETLGVPSRDGQGWSPQLVGRVLANPKYTGYMVYGRTKNVGKSQRPGERKNVREPRDKWVWSPEPTHPALVTMEVWEAAQEIGPANERIRDAGKPAKRGRRTYPFRSRIMCNQCQRRMTGANRDGRRPGTSYTYYICPHRKNNPRHAQNGPGTHVRAAVREETLTAAVAGFLDQYVFGSGRAAQLAAILPATAAEAASHRRQQLDTLHKKLAKCDTREKGAARTIADLGDSDDPADKALRQRAREIFKDVYTERTTLTGQIAELSSAPADENDPALLDEIPRAASMLLQAPDTIREQLYAALDLQILYRADKNQATIWVTLTENTPRLITALTDDTRTDSDTGWTTSLFAYAYLRTGGIAPETAIKARLEGGFCRLFRLEHLGYRSLHRARGGDAQQRDHEHQHEHVEERGQPEGRRDAMDLRVLGHGRAR